eukprot:164992-Chlamydomonas_euryale.AAC.2
MPCPDLGASGRAVQAASPYQDPAGRRGDVLGGSGGGGNGTMRPQSRRSTMCWMVLRWPACALSRAGTPTCRIVWGVGGCGAGHVHRAGQVGPPAGNGEVYGLACASVRAGRGGHHGSRRAWASQSAPERWKDYLGHVIHLKRGAGGAERHKGGWGGPAATAARSAVSVSEMDGWRSSSRSGRPCIEIGITAMWHSHVTLC